jgi:glycosyltransferase involved in cell wall biosynthesis
MMVLPTPVAISFEAGIPYVMAIHDLQHRLQPEFPEVSMNGEWEAREYLFHNGVRHATLILVDSEVGKEDVLNAYGALGISESRIRVLPFAPTPYLDPELPSELGKEIRSGYGLRDPYLFYPAQFWPHKNHGRIVEAIARLRDTFHLKVEVVFSGAHDDELKDATWRRVNHLVSILGLEERVHFLGYIPDDHMSALYAGASALVMPTFFGPTNIPVVEAWSMGCPVITSDIRGIREHAGEAAQLVDPWSVDSISDGIHRVLTEEGLRESLRRAGLLRAQSYTNDDFSRKIVDIVTEAKALAHSEGFAPMLSHDLGKRA